MSKINFSILVAFFFCFTLTANSQQKEFNTYYTELHKLDQFNGNVLVAGGNADGFTILY